MIDTCRNLRAAGIVHPEPTRGEARVAQGALAWFSRKSSQTSSTIGATVPALTSSAQPPATLSTEADQAPGSSGPGRPPAPPRRSRPPPLPPRPRIRGSMPCSLFNSASICNDKMIPPAQRTLSKKPSGSIQFMIRDTIFSPGCYNAAAVWRKPQRYVSMD